MSYEFIYTANLKNGKSFKLKEISFFDYKNICKAIYNQVDTTELNKIFTNILQNSVIDSKPLNLHEKIILLINIRGLTLGKEIKINYNQSEIVINTDYLLEKLDIEYKPFEYMFNDMVLTFGVPYNFVITPEDAIKCVCESLLQITYEDKTINLEGLSEKDKNELMLQFSGLPITDIFKQIYDNYKNISFKIAALGDFELNLFDATFLHFFKFVFDEKFDSVLDLEYNLRRNLNFNINDFKTVSYPEAKIMLNKYAAELKERAKNNSGNMNEPY